MFEPIKLAYPFNFLEVPVPNEESGQSCICVRVLILPLFHNFAYRFIIVPTVWYFFVFFILIYDPLVRWINYWRLWKHHFHGNSINSILVIIMIPLAGSSLCPDAKYTTDSNTPL